MSNDDWYTPEWLLRSVRVVANSEISMDPASNNVANKWVRATRFFDVGGLDSTWGNGVCLWLNPPYSKPLPWVDKFIVERRHFIHSFILLNAGIGTRAVQWILHAADMRVCFFDKRIQFISGTGQKSGSNRNGQMLGYSGPYEHMFINEFSRYGAVR